MLNVFEKEANFLFLVMYNQLIFFILSAFPSIAKNNTIIWNFHHKRRSTKPMSVLAKFPKKNIWSKYVNV